MQGYCAKCDDYQELTHRVGFEFEPVAAWVCTVCGRDATEDCGLCHSDARGCRCND
jgi:hypothetical protein